MRRSDVMSAGRVRHSAAGRVASLRRGTVLVAAALTALPLAGCATKRDLRDLRTEVVALQARQDSIYLLLAEQNQVVLDSVRAGNEIILRVRGELGHQLLQMEQQLVQIQELTGQSQRRLAQLRQDLESRNRQFEAGAPVPQPSEPSSDLGGDVAEMYRAGVEKLREGSTTTARAVFQEIVQRHATHELAPDAQYQLAETYVVERDYEQAMREFDRVLELFPGSSRAPSALYRAGLIAEERGNISRARDYFNRVRAGYPTSDEARLAADKLRDLPRR